MTFTNTVGQVNYYLWEHVAREKAADHTVPATHKWAIQSSTQ